MDQDEAPAREPVRREQRRDARFGVGPGNVDELLVAVLGPDADAAQRVEVGLDVWRGVDCGSG